MIKLVTIIIAFCKLQLENIYYLEPISRKFSVKLKTSVYKLIFVTEIYDRVMIEEYHMKIYYIKIKFYGEII